MKIDKKIDIFQKRYEEHQARKKYTLQGIYESEVKYKDKEINTVLKVFQNRKSSRVFNKEYIYTKELGLLLEMVDHCPSSCDRKGVGFNILETRNDKDLLGGLLVGGTGWVHRANKVILLFADMEAYKSPAEKDNMPYLDAGVLIMAFYLASEVLGLKCCYVNPNIREENKEFFNSRFNKDNKLFCGAIALGK